MRPEQYEYDTEKRPQRRFDDERCEWCNRLLLGNETERFYFDRPKLCHKCSDEYERVGRW